MNDELSRLLDGELPESEANALRARIAANPDLARKWAAMQALPSQLAALPRELPGLPAPPVGSSLRALPSIPDVQSMKTRRAPRWLWAPVLLAAGLAAGLLVPEPRAEIRIVKGSEVVSGRVDVLAGDVAVELDGKIEISVEPPRGVSRERQAEVRTMDKSHFIAALSGAIVTLTVVEGTALAHPPGQSVVKISKGEHRTLGVLATSGLPVSATPSANGSHEDLLAHELAALKLEHAVTVGQLRALGGRAVEWPDDVAPKYRAQAFEDFVRGRVASIPNSSLVATDCDEYPCIAVVRSTDMTDQWEDKLMAVHDDLDHTEYGSSNNVIGFGSIREDERGIAKLYAFSIVPGDEGIVDQEVRSRLDVRVRGDMEGLADELLEQPDEPEQ